MSNRNVFLGELAWKTKGWLASFLLMKIDLWFDLKYLFNFGQRKVSWHKILYEDLKAIWNLNFLAEEDILTTKLQIQVLWARVITKPYMYDGKGYSVKSRSRLFCCFSSLIIWKNKLLLKMYWKEGLKLWLEVRV